MNAINLDLMGLKCPEPLMMLRSKVRKMESGQTIVVKTDDPSTLRDIPKFCEFQDHSLTSMVDTGPYEFTITKG